MRVRLRGLEPGRVSAVWRIRLVAYGARLESVLGASPRGFESLILRHQPRSLARNSSFWLDSGVFCVLDSCAWVGSSWPLPLDFRHRAHPLLREQRRCVGSRRGGSQWSWPDTAALLP